MKKKQRIPSYMNARNSKNKSEINFEKISKLFKIWVICLPFCWSINIFLWALRITSWDINDAGYILSKEGPAGGINKTLPIIFAEILLLFPHILILAIAFSFLFLYSFYVTEVKKRTFIRRDYLVSILLLFIPLFAIWIFFNKLRYFYNDLGILDQNNQFIDFIVILTIIIPLSTAFVFLIMVSVVLKYKNINFLNIFNDKVFMLILSMLIGISQLGIFVYVPYTSYNKGYGTECMYISVAAENSEVQKDRIYKLISSGGIEVVDILSKKADGKKHGYTLSSYVYSEDKDYLNVMVFSVREMSEDDTPGNDLLGYKSGVLMSIKKSSIAGRYASHPYCFNGKL